MDNIYCFFSFSIWQSMSIRDQKFYGYYYRFTTAIILPYLNGSDVSGKGMFLNFQHMKSRFFFQPFQARRRITPTHMRFHMTHQFIIRSFRHLLYELILSATTCIAHSILFYSTSTLRVSRILHPFIISPIFVLLLTIHDIKFFVKLVLHKFLAMIMRAIGIMVLIY